MRVRNLFEEQQLSTIVFTFGRFNPPTIGHEILINKVKQVAEQFQAEYIIFSSQSQDKKKNPLSYAEKIFFMEQMFPGTNFNKNTSIKTPFQALEELGKKYDRAVLVVGSDRVPEFKTRMAPYVEEFGYKDLVVVSAGERDPDADDASGMSASKARELAIAGDLDQFKQAIPGNNKLAEMMYNKVRSGLGIVNTEPVMAEGSIGSAINFPGYNDKEDKKKNKEKKKSIVDKIKSAVGLGESEMDKATLAYLQGIDTSSSLWKKSKKGKIQSDEIENMQFVLKSLGYNPGPIDGWFGNKTADAVRQFQKDNDLTVDGDPGKNTIGKMIDVVSVNVFGDPEDDDITATYIDKDGNDTGIPATLGKSGGADYELDKLIHTAKTAIGERSLTKDEEKDKEKYVKGMKKNKKDFKKRYGDDAEAVMYATATKMAKESVNELKGDHDRMAIADAEFNKIVATLADAGIPLTKELNQWRREGGLVNVIRNLIPFINKKFEKVQSYDIDRYFKSADFNSKTPAEKKKLVPALLNIKKAQEIIPEIVLQLRTIQKDLEAAGITEAEQQSMPAKIKPLAVPKFPPMPEQEGDMGDGAIARQTKLGMTLSNADGTFLWDASGKPSQWRSPAMAGMSQTHDLKTGVITVRYNNGGLKVTKRFDKDGNSLDAGDVAYGMGDVNRSKNADGSTKEVYSAGAYRLEVTKDANGQSKETYWKHNSKTDRVEVSANEVPADIMAALAQSRKSGITEKIQTALPKKIKISKMPTPPKAPTADTPDGTSDDGVRIKTTAKGNRSVSSGAGTYIFSPQGKLMLYMTPKIGGLQQTHNLQKQTVTVNFGTGIDNVNVSQKGTYDMQGNLVSADNTNMSSGGVAIDIDKEKGSTLDYRLSDKKKVSVNSKTGLSVGEEKDSSLLSKLKGVFDFSGGEMEEKYIPFVVKNLRRYGDRRTKELLKKEFPNIKPTDVEKAMRMGMDIIFKRG